MTKNAFEIDHFVPQRIAPEREIYCLKTKSRRSGKEEQVCE